MNVNLIPEDDLMQLKEIVTLANRIIDLDFKLENLEEMKDNVPEVEADMELNHEYVELSNVEKYETIKMMIKNTQKQLKEQLEDFADVSQDLYKYINAYNEVLLRDIKSNESLF